MEKNGNPLGTRTCSLWFVYVSVYNIYIVCMSVLRALLVYIYSRIHFWNIMLCVNLTHRLALPYVTLIYVRRYLHNCLWFSAVSWSIVFLPNFVVYILRSKLLFITSCTINLPRPPHCSSASLFSLLNLDYFVQKYAIDLLLSSGLSLSDFLGFVRFKLWKF